MKDDRRGWIATWIVALVGGIIVLSVLIGKWAELAGAVQMMGPDRGYDAITIAQELVTRGWIWLAGGVLSGVCITLGIVGLVKKIGMR